MIRAADDATMTSPKAGTIATGIITMSDQEGIGMIYRTGNLRGDIAVIATVEAEAGPPIPPSVTANVSAIIPVLGMKMQMQTAAEGQTRHQGKTESTVMKAPNPRLPLVIVKIVPGKGLVIRSGKDELGCDGSNVSCHCTRSSCRLPAQVATE